VSKPRILKPISPDYIGAYLDDKVQLFDVIEEILLQIGSSRLIITSFSVSEEFIRKLHHFKLRALISHAELIIDAKAAIKVRNMLPFAQNVFDEVRLGNNHSKLILFESLKGDKISLVTSQNQTRGNRYESGMITSNEAIYKQLKELYEYLYSQSRLISHDIAAY
jgi:hypothetical protein